MLKPRLHIIIAALLVLAMSPVRADEVSATTLPSGLKVIVREGHAVNLAAIDIWVRAGSINETAANCGVSHFIEHMIFKATDKYGPGEIDRVIESLGADLNGGTTEDYTHYYTTVPSADLPTALNVIADAIVHPKFSAEEMEKERRVILDELARRESDPTQRALDVLDGLIFPTHPYGRSMAGTRETIGKLTRDDLVNYYSAHFTPANTCVVIAGDVSKADALALVGKAFADWSARVLTGTSTSVVSIGTDAHEDTGAPGTGAATTSPQIKRVACKVSQAYVAVGFRAPGIADFKETCALDAMLILFGDTAHGRIADALTGAGIPFSRIKADYVTHRDPSVFSVIAAVDPADADRAVLAIVGEFGKPAKYQVSEDELSYARRLIVGSDLYEQETFAGQARSIGFYDSIRSYDLSLKYVETVQSITSADITALARKYFATDGYAVAILHPEVAGK